MNLIYVPIFNHLNQNVPFVHNLLEQSYKKGKSIENKFSWRKNKHGHNYLKYVKKFYNFSWLPQNIHIIKSIEISAFFPIDEFRVVKCNISLLLNLFSINFLKIIDEKIYYSKIHNDCKFHCFRRNTKLIIKLFF